ncbi:hydrocephalus-inducing protein homolog [Rhea pennata]|uniref:hydrocephalus-inducing protein homolog n=1 Tax=Rhea pennata TaxID=8795 RepID=UPI002E277024
MATSNLHQLMGSSKIPDGFQSKAVAPRNPKLVKEAEKSVTLTPSAFLKEMSLTTEQRLASTHEMRRPRIIQLLDMSETSHQKFSALDLEQSLFQPFPSEVVFQNYIPCETYEVPLILRNNDKIPRLVKVVLESSPYFKLISPNDVCHKVAPGMPSTFRILFTPEENKDYFHQVTCITEREKFIVPVRAIGARAILDFPDQLNFSVCPVKYATQKTLLVHNIGNREARYCISTQSPFSADPSVGTLGIGDTMQVTVEFHPLETGDHSRALIVHYDTGEDIHTSLYGAAVDVNIRLDKNSLIIEKTYLTLANQRAVVIHNRSEIIAHFQWKAFATREEEDRQKMRLCRRLQSQEEDETDRFLEECSVDPTLRERLSILSRTFQNHRAKVKGDAMLFSDDIFSIEPVEGDVWPNSTAEINVIFKPREARVYQQTVYCDISGRETRLPLRIRGEGVGPKLRFGFDQLDIGKVFVGSAHSYEAILFNKGAIDALFSLVPPATALGSCFTFHPQEGIILPEGLQAIQISFRSTILGEFTEEFGFSVHGSPEPVTLTIRGCVIGPTFHFSVPSLDFGDVSFGFPCTLSCCLNNTSLVPMTFTLRIPGDGPGEPSVTSFVQISDDTRPSWRRGVQGRVKPTEFTITPCRGTVRSQGLLDIQVTLCSNTVKKYELALVVDVDGVGKEVLALLLTARCVVPSLQVLNPVVKFGRCFLKFPYRQTLTLVNDSDLPGCYGVLPQEHKDAAAVWYFSPLPCGIIQPHSSVEIPFTLEAQVMGEKDTVAHIAVFGSEGFPLKIHLLSTGEGPVVHVYPSKIDFGNIQVLQDASQTLHLSNQTLIPASFWAQMAGKNSRWRIEPSEGVVPPETEVSVSLIANLDDTEKFNDKVNLCIEHNSTCEIPVQAVGIGTTIVTDKPFAPELNLGPHFSQEPCYYRFKITNRGRRTHQLYWTTEGFAPFRQRDHLPAPTNAKGKNSSQSLRPASPIFKLRPLRMELTPGKTMDMMLEGFSRTAKVAKERLLCHAIIGSKTGKKKIMQVDVTCEFIAPVLQISAREITFRVEKEANDVLTPQYEPLNLKNISSLPVSVILSLEQPFSLCDVDRQPIYVDGRAIKLEVGEELHLSIKFNPAFHEGLDIRVAKVALIIRFVEHSHEEHIALRGEVYFPNLRFQTTAVNFGCLLNDTEDVRYIEMTNCSPLLVRYNWSFLTESHASQMRFSPPRPKFFIEPQSPKEEEARTEQLAAVENDGFVRSFRDANAEKKAHGMRAAGDRAQEPAGPKDSPDTKPLISAAKEEKNTAKTQNLMGVKELLPVTESKPFALGVEEVFDILPLYGTLQPGESQQVTFTFYGHANIVARVTAQCKVEGGPTYEIALSGEASLINYLFDVKAIDCGLQLFNEVSEMKLTLQNSGKVRFKYVVLSASTASADNPLPGVPLVVPATGYVGSGKEQVLKVYYLPGVPGDFYRTFQIQVGHLEPEEISLKGEGIFPRIYVGLPRNIKGNVKYEKLLKKAKEKLKKGNRREEAIVLQKATTVERHTDSDSLFNTWLLMEMERVLIEEHALKQQEAFTSCPTEDPALGQQARQRLVKAQLPEYILDFGYIILGNAQTHIVKITNTGQFPVSFHADVRALRDTGFSIELHRVKHLPFCETEMFTVRFDSQSANLPLGQVKALLPIKVTGGPTFHICLRAMVTVPSLCLSCDRLEFSSVQCGQCQEKTIQLQNCCQIACRWFISMNEHVKKVDKHLPVNLRRKLREELRTKTPVFQVLPSSGNLTPGQRCNLQVRFSPSEERAYSTRLKVNICQSNLHPELQLLGHGLEPRLDFSPPVLELGPLLPYSKGVQATVVVKNPCDFPIEFYSLDFDQEYLTEELILRMLQDYDCHNTLLLPPRAPGEKLPPEVLEYYEDQKRLQDEQAESKPVESTGCENENSEDIQSPSDQEGKYPTGVVHTVSSHTSIIPPSFFDESQFNKVDFKLEHEEEEEEDIEKKHRPEEHQQKHTSSKEAVGELDSSPVKRAIARYLGIDISPEGRAAEKRRGIVVIIHGAPLTGKTSAATALSKYYGVPCLSIDSVVTKAISQRSSSAGLRARELCIEAAVSQAHEDPEDAGKPSAQQNAGPRALLQTLTPIIQFFLFLPIRRRGFWQLLPVLGNNQHADLCSLPLSARANGPCSSAGKAVLQPVSARGRGNQGVGKGKTEGHTPQHRKQHQTDQQGPTTDADVAGETAAKPCVLPEDLLETILSERMQLSDCYQGVVFDGLETIFAHNIHSALLCLLRAINNRPHIYFVNLFQDYATMKAKEKDKREQEEREQKEAAMREKARLQELDEEAYDALTEEQKSHFDKELRQVLRERKKREMERLARELEQKKQQQQQELDRLKEEEELKKKAKRWKKDLGKEKDIASGRRSQFGARQGMNTSTSSRSDIKLNEGDDRRGSAKERSDSVSGDKEDKKKRNKTGLLDACPVVVVSPTGPEQDRTEKEAMNEVEKILALRFKLYEASQKGIIHILSFWDRVQGILLSPLEQEEVQPEAEEQRQPSSSRRSRKDREKERLEKERLEKERLEKERLEKERLEQLKALEESKLCGQEKEGAEGEGKDQHAGVPYLEIQVLSLEDASWKKILESGKLPGVEQILDSLGLGPSGPPIPPPAFYSVIHYPEKRMAPAVSEALQHFVFVAPEAATAEEEKKDTESLTDALIMPAVKVPEEQVTPTRGRARKEKVEGSRESSRDKRSTARGRRGLQGPASGVLTHHTDADQSSVSRDSSPEKIIRLTNFRWIVAAHGEVVLKIHFSSIVPGQFDQTFNFEILGTGRLYQLFCRGTCVYPTICQDPRLVFPHRRKSKARNDIIFKQYVMDTGVFHFGPLLCGKSRQWYKASRYPSNCEKITILNITPLEAEVHFFLEHDANADTFLFEPPRMTLKANEKQELTIWAYPTSSGVVEDSLVCCIKDNPEPVVFRLCCHGVRLELGLNCRLLNFDKLLLHRKDSKTLVLQNSTPLPAVWRLSGVESLGEDFSVSQDHGTIGPYTKFSLQLHFRASKALSVKKTIRLEVSDAENVLGIVQIENIQILAEAYDVALNITFPKVADSNLDFGILKVMDEAKITLNLKNKGKYEIAYSFTLEAVDTNIPDLTSHFTIQPQKGVLTASERPAQVQMVFHPKREMKIEDKPILQCQLIEPNVSEGGETIAVIPVRVSANALFTKYSIYPASFINFGAIMSGTKKSCTFTLENKGILDFKFVICKTIRDVPVLPRKGASPVKYTHSHESENLSKIPPSLRQSKQTDSLQKDVNPVTQARITLGIFTVYPGFGSIPPGGQQAITVDCYADSLGMCEEYLSIDISDRDPKDNPLGIPYTLAAESCLPAFVVDDIGSIFEEHRICSNINLCHILQTVQDKGVFVMDENMFIFTNVLVGHQATARFKICNVDKIPCDVVLSIKPASSKLSTHAGDVFEVDPVRMCVPSHSHAFATVTFTPQTMQNYQCTFEACLDVLASPAAFKPQSLTFTISGDGNLPRVTILRPVLHNKRGNPLLLFKKLLLGHSEKLPLILHNSGIIPVQVMMDLLDEEGVFFLKARPTTHCIYQAPATQESSAGEGRKPHATSLVLHNGESAEFDVLFKPNLIQHVEGKIRLSIVDNPYEETNVLLVGEGYQDDFTLDNIHGLVADNNEENTEANLEEDVIEAARVDHIQFGGCHIGTPYQATFTITNHSNVEAMRFEWLASTPFHFSPQVGHLHAGCAKDITVTLKSDVAVTFKMHPVKCKVAKITFQLPADQVPDWDDRLHTVKWVDATRGQPTKWPVKKKVIETDPEPAHTVLEGSSREVELCLSAVIDYAEFKLDMEMIQFKETMLFQTRTFTFHLSNTGNVALEYTWMADVEDKKAVSYSGELLLTSPEGDFHSSTYEAPVKLQASCCSSQLGCTLEHVSSSPCSSPSTINVTPQFAVEPCNGTIPAGQEQVFQMKFSPVDVGEFQSCMLCSIPNLKPNQKGPEVVVRGKSLLPHCHFELEDSDYITANRRNPDLRGPKGTTLDRNTRVIEFSAVGVCSRNSRAFLLMNPTSSTYSFQWTCQDPEAPREQPAFSCLTEKGQIQPEKKAEIKFEFIPQHLDITESFWVFTIPEQSVSIPFLLVGNATDPLVSLDRSHLNFRSLLVGHEMYQTIYMINSEKEAFSFAFRENSLFPEGCNAYLKVEPLEGSIAPLSRCSITIFLIPILEGEVVFNLICDVKRKPQPLSLNIKATAYSMNVSVRFEDSDGCVAELSAQEINIIDFKKVELNENIQNIFTISNTGKLSFTFSWELSGPPARKQFLTITPQMGTVEAEGKAETLLTFHPRKICSVKNVELTLQISRGPTFICALLATVVVPTVHFSFTKLNFGACFVYHAGMLPSQQTLVITNKADKDVSLNCLFTSTAHLEVDFPGYVLSPGGTVEVPITFYPREAVSYHELVPFEINGLSQQTIEVRGRGAEMKVDIVEPQSKVVKLGALSIGQTVKKLVTIANNSAAPLTFKLNFMYTMPELQEAGVLCLNPANEISLKPKGDTCKVEVIFSPKHRILPFSEEVMLECHGLVRFLCMVQGSCQGIDVSLDREHINFGVVLQQSRTCQRILMQNTGDIGVKFKWAIKSFKPDFSISPTRGYISPGMDIPLLVTFHPSKSSQAIQYDGLQCFIQGSEPLRLTLAGCCMEVPATKETLNFTCDVREKQSQTILLSNPSNEPWTMQPVIEGQHWEGPEFFHLDASQQNKPYEITYKPLTMTSENKKHQGSIFFPLPDGTGLQYLLQGTAEAPKCSGSIFREVPCRTPYTELIPVSNWLNRPQRFVVVVDILKPEKLESSSVLQGLEYIDVPGFTQKDYKLTFLSYKEGIFSTMVTFLNEVTEEYLFYMATFKATASGPISTIELVTPIRESVSSSVRVDNPLSIPVTFATDCKVPEISVPPLFTVPALSEADLVFEYQPLKTGESTGHLVLQSNDLGSFCYDLNLKATASRPEKPLYFCTALGSNQTMTAKFINYVRQKTDYVLQSDCADFQTEKTISVAPACVGGSEVGVEVTYEPCQLGESRATLLLSSPLSGEYSIPLFGLSIPPKPQGPFQIKAGCSTSIPFKNVFLQHMTFRYDVENPAFTVRATENLRSKKNIFITVSFEGSPAGSKAPVTSKLVVSCARAAGLGADVSWVYYLRGITPEK